MELIEEEKEAIKTLEEILKEWQKIVDIEDPIERECEMSCYMEDMPFYQIKILLKLVKKQQNKIDAKEMEHQYDQKMIDDLKGEMVHNWIHKDKIREKMREIIGYTFTTSEERHCQNYAYDRLKELL